MLSKDELLKEYQSQGIVSSSSLYLDLQTSFDFVNACSQNNLAVVGLEGFVYQDGKLLPQLDLIADCSLDVELLDWSEYREQCNAHALNILQALPVREGLVINFVVVSKQE